jgi:hypothetical protein
MAKLSPAGVALFGNTGVPDPTTPFGLGSQLRQQTAAEIEEEERKKRLGLSALSPSGGSPALRALLGAGGMSLGGLGSGLR